MTANSVPGRELLFEEVLLWIGDRGFFEFCFSFVMEASFRKDEHEGEESFLYLKRMQERFG